VTPRPTFELAYNGGVALDRKPRGDAQESFAGWMVAVLGPIAVAALLVPLREELVPANLALILVVVVVLAAVAGGRASGAAAAVIAALSYDFFLTEPYLSLHIESADDIETALILLAIGLIVGQLVVVVRRGQGAVRRGAAELAALHRVSDVAATSSDLDELTRTVEQAVRDVLGLEACWFEPPPYQSLPAHLERGGAVVGAELRVASGGFALPADGLELPVMGRGEVRGRLVLMPREDHGTSVEERVVALSLADQLGAALAAAPP
jgi:K+-sensing histidine kinase KdpD